MGSETTGGDALDRRLADGVPVADGSGETGRDETDAESDDEDEDEDEWDRQDETDAEPPREGEDEDDADS
ncbi:hypothetical protein [Salinilacihabitans rarus]|uniref:hypothetical protein n=1 Tax=Salinilacihabitans rarus TaxID=2961596 RepID=UPI0020C8B885|nr:hypothetical protein [Salinilacihabitans rarus]